jgi:hypothetical protein
VVEETTELTPAERFRVALKLFEDGVRIMEQNLRRAHPDASDEEIEQKLREWLHHRPGAEHGDCVGRPLAWPLDRR